MSRGEIARVFRALYADGIRLVFVQGGEPMLRRDLVEVLEDLAAIGFSLTLITNGTRLTQETVERLVALPLSYSISLDTLNRDRYRQIRGADQLALVSAGVALLAKARNPKYLTCIVSDVNRGDVLEVVRFARSQGFIPVVGAYHWGLDRYGKVDPLLQYEQAQAAAVFRAVAQSGLVPRGYYRQYVQDNIDWLEGRSLGRCDAGRYSIEGDRVIHHVEVCWIPNWEGRDLVRLASFPREDRILLRTPGGTSARPSPLQEVLWERMK